VVVVLMTSCQVSEKSKIGPLKSQPIIRQIAKTKVPALPAMFDTFEEILRKKLFIEVSITDDQVRNNI
jgi:hypothetical protein